jgi:hypothetical protein
LRLPPETDHGRESERDEIDRLDKVLAFAQRLASIRMPNSRDRSGWETALDFAKEPGPTVVQPVLQLINNAMVLKSQANGAPRPASGMATVPIPTLAAFDPYASPEILRQHSQAMNVQETTPAAASQGPATAFSQGSASQSAAPVAGTTAQTPPGPPPANELVALIQAYGGLIITHLNQGTPGCIFAEWIRGLLGTGMHAHIVAQGGTSPAPGFARYSRDLHIWRGAATKFVNESVIWTSRTPRRRMPRSMPKRVGA